jgi:hypothetical protein
MIHYSNSRYHPEAAWRRQHFAYEIGDPLGFGLGVGRYSGARSPFHWRSSPLTPLRHRGLATYCSQCFHDLDGVEAW